ncbi:MAG: RlmE family RNA methyltransferase [Deltaproteobacteria bacterium]|nr:RlmE family RNA methyltransferase [Deltaproteobacteria bacterium]
MASGRRKQDHFAKRAKRENFPARSVYKLEEMNRRVRLVRRGDRVLDLGAAPGSWTLYAATQVGPQGLVVAVDLSAIAVALPSHVVAMEADVMSIDAEALRERCGGPGFDAVISDMAPSTMGHRFVDQSRSYALFSRALDLAELLCRPGGRFAGKIFQGEDFAAARERVARLFSTVRILRPRSVRSESYEVYVVGLDRRRAAPA